MAELDDIEWFFRIESYYGEQPPRFVHVGSANVSVLPGRPWSEMPRFKGLWYPATKRNCFEAVIASGSLLRFFIYLPNPAETTYQWRAAGRLHARTQTEICKEARLNARTFV